MQGQMNGMQNQMDNMQNSIENLKQGQEEIKQETDNQDIAQEVNTEGLKTEEVIPQENDNGITVLKFKNMFM